MLQRLKRLGVKGSRPDAVELRRTSSDLGDARASDIQGTSPVANGAVNTSPTFNAIGTSGTVTMVAGHFINGDYNVYSGVNKIDVILPSESAGPNPPSAQPLPPDIFYGRDDLISDLAGLVSRTEQPRVAVLGPGGMGKTALALHLIHHETVIARYRNRRYFVGCDALPSAAALAQRILQSIDAVSNPGENPVEAAHRALKAAAPTLLLLDNFESVWEAEADHAAVRDLLRKLVDGPATALVVTMRTASPPPGIRWTIAHNLSPLSPSPARDVFLAINTAFTDVSDDDNAVLDELLKELDYVPLAIHLLAQISLGLSAAFVLKQWREQRTSLLSLDPSTQDKLESIDVSIALSVTSLDVTRNPQAIQLLGMLCLLPDGLLHYEERLAIITRTFLTSMSDFFLLRKLALVYTSGSKLGVLSPIRHFILAHHPPDTQHAQCIYGIFWKLVDTYALVKYGSDFHDVIKALGPEAGNIASLVEHAAQHDPADRTLEVAINMSWHLYRTQPSTNLLHKVSQLVPGAAPATQARYWRISGDIAAMQSRYPDATRSLAQAQNRFAALGDELQAADCAYGLGEVLRMQDRFGEASALFAEARTHYRALGEHTGVARCLARLGDVLYLQGRYPDASAMLTEARAEFDGIGDRLGATQCLMSLGNIMLMQARYAEAAAMLREARVDYLDIGHRLGVAQCLRSLGNILRMQGRYLEASDALNEARGEFLKIGSSLGAAQCLRSLGDTLRDQGNNTEASSALTEARVLFLEIGDRLGEARCLRSLGRILVAQGSRAEGVASLRRARDLFLEIGLESDAAKCSETLDSLSSPWGGFRIGREAPRSVDQDARYVGGRNG
ncbi:hypothetical protein HWV62_16572 [Athelia sp. TMB]|nr:hypothetical protein HWV62_16572 [Athelia sp. TMB]